MEFKIGDRVVTTVYYSRTGIPGTIREITCGKFGVEHDSNIGGHYLNGLCKDGYGWFYSSSELKLVNSSTDTLILLL